MNINQTIFNLIKEKNLKQSDLATKLNVSTGQITTWKKRGTTPPAEYLADICEFLDVSIYEILGIENKELTENEKEMLHHFKKLPEREQLKLIGKIEEIAEKYSSAKSLDSKIG